jgi:hypothetical protein
MPDAADPFRVIYVSEVRDQLRMLGIRATELGIRDAFRLTLREFDERLRAAPQDLGEPVYRLEHLDLPVRVSGTRFFYARFAIDEERRLVYVVACEAAEPPAA